VRFILIIVLIFTPLFGHWAAGPANLRCQGSTGLTSRFDLLEAYRVTNVRAVKKLHPPQKAALDEAVRRVASQPSIGDAKVGDLVGVQVYKFRMGQLLCLLAYRMLDGDTIKLLMVGPHENFYRDLKRSDH
jgi:hypothetical protein